MTAPRIFCIPAARAPVAAVIARGPSDWVRLGRWDLQRDDYEHGAWLAGTVYPQRCDLSPDGRWFAYFALKPSSTWDAGPTYIAVSRLPWFTALVAWGTDGTWTNRVRFVTLRKGRPGAEDVALRVGGRFAAFRDNRNYDPEVWYALEREGALETLEDVQWADWMRPAGCSWRRAMDACRSVGQRIPPLRPRHGKSICRRTSRTRNHLPTKRGVGEKP